MPNRIIKESICTSDNIDTLTPFQETMWYRLIVNCDDFGRFDGRDKILASKLYPLKSIDINCIAEAKQALVNAGLIIVYTVDGRPYIQVRTWDKHQQKRASKSKYPCMGEILQSIDINCNQPITNVPVIENRESLYEKRESSSVFDMTDDAAHETQREQDIVLNATENAGFNRSPMVRAKIVDLYSQYGKDKILDAINECVRHGVTNIAYLEAVLKGKPKQAKVRVPAQDFEQRDYAEVEEDLMTKLARDMEEFKRTGAVT